MLKEMNFMRMEKFVHLRIPRTHCIWNLMSTVHQAPIISLTWLTWEKLYEPRYVKIIKVTVRPAKPHISLGIHPVWSESSPCAQWVAKDPRFLHADSGDSDQTGRMSRLIGVFAGRTLILLVLSCRGSWVHIVKNNYLQPWLKSLQQGLSTIAKRINVLWRKELRLILHFISFR